MTETESASQHTSPGWRAYVKPWFWVIVILVVVADLWTKDWAQDNLTTSVVVVTTPEGEQREKLVHKWFRDIDDPRRDEGVDWWPGIVHFKWAENFGAAFSIGSNQRGLLITVQIAVLIAVLVYTVRVSPQRKLLLLCLAGITGGALGNLYDRAMFQTVDHRQYLSEDTPNPNYGEYTTAVRDFLYWPFDIPVYSTWGLSDEEVEQWGTRKWPIFNIADCCIMTGVGGLVLILLVSPAPPKRRDDQDEPAV